MSCFLPSENRVIDFLIAGYSAFLHFGEALGSRVDSVVPPRWGDKWYQRMFPGARATASRDDHFDPEAVLRAVVTGGPVAPTTLSDSDRTELRELLFPGMNFGDLRELRRYRGIYAHYDGMLASVSTARAALDRALAMLATVAERSWSHHDLAAHISLASDRVHRLTEGIPIPQSAPAAPNDISRALGDLLAGLVSEGRAREERRVDRRELRLGDPYPGDPGGRVFRLLESSDDLWDLEAGTPLGDQAGASVVADLVRAMRNVIIDNTVRLDPDDGTFSGQFVGESRYLGRLPDPNDTAIDRGALWPEDALLLPRTYRLGSDGVVLSLDEPDLNVRLPSEVEQRLADGFAAARKKAGVDVDSCDVRLAVSGRVVCYLGDHAYEIDKVSAEEWFPRHFEVG